MRWAPPGSRCAPACSPAAGTAAAAPGRDLRRCRGRRSSAVAVRGSSPGPSAARRSCARRSSPATSSSSFTTCPACDVPCLRVQLEGLLGEAFADVQRPVGLATDQLLGAAAETFSSYRRAITWSLAPGVENSRDHRRGAVDREAARRRCAELVGRPPRRCRRRPASCRRCREVNGVGRRCARGLIVCSAALVKRISPGVEARPVGARRARLPSRPRSAGRSS